MKTVKTKGIIIAEKVMSDFDKMLTILTPNMGKIECVAKGSRRPKSLLMAGTQFLCFGDYMLYKGGENYSMNSCETIELFYNIRTDLDKLKYAVYITKIINDVTTENQNNYKILQLYLNTLYVISNTEKDLEFVTSIFRLRLLSIIGYRPEIEECKTCKEKENLTKFSIRDNGFKCTACGKQDKGAIDMSETTKDAIRYIILSDAKKIYSFQVPKESIEELKIISKLYLTEKLEKEYKM
jgi:DNA repair protein RecO (recombination protein O)